MRVSMEISPSPSEPANEAKPTFVTDVIFIFSETVLKFRALKKPAQLAVINSLEKVPRPSCLHKRMNTTRTLG